MEVFVHGWDINMENEKEKKGRSQYWRSKSGEKKNKEIEEISDIKLFNILDRAHNCLKF